MYKSLILNSFVFKIKERNEIGYSTLKRTSSQDFFYCLLFDGGLYLRK